MLTSSILDKNSTAMSPRPWTSRGARRLPKNSSYLRTARPTVKLTKESPSHTLRLIRRYMPQKSEKIRPKNKNIEIDAGTSAQHPALKVSTSELPNSVADKKNNTRRPIMVTKVTAAPYPTPDAGLTATNSLGSMNSFGAWSPLFDVLSDATPVGSTVPIEITPALTGKRPFKSFSVLLSPSTIVPAGTRAVLPTQIQVTGTAQAQSGNPRSHQVSVVVVILLSIVSALLLLGFAIVVRICSRPRRGRLVPSLPVLKNAESEDDLFETKESSLFGGDERLSANPFGPLWSWIQYPHRKNAQPQVQNDLPSQDSYGYSGQAQDTGSQPTQNLHSPTSVASQLREIPKPQLHTAASVITLAGGRSSSASLGIYASTAPTYPSNNARQETTSTVDGHHVIKRSKSKTANKRQSQASFDSTKRESTVSSAGLAYDGEDVIAPSSVEYDNHVLEDTPVMDQGYQGRTKVKAGYFAAITYPRVSTLPSASYSIATATRINVGQRNSFSRDKFSPHKSNSKRLRDGQALTSALGLASPRKEYDIASPQPTLYPDDFVSIIESKRPKRRNVNDREAVEAAPDIPAVVPMVEATDNNTLMRVNLRASETLLSGLPLTSDNYDAAKPSSRLLQNTDRPPTVPSSLPLPLTQNGLAHSNPEAYASYRSPIYRLYGL